MAWYQRAKDKARIGELEAELSRIGERYVDLIHALKRGLSQLRKGAVDKAILLLEAEYESHKGKLEAQRKGEG